MCKDFFIMAENPIRCVITKIYLRCGKKNCTFVSLDRFIFERHLVECNKDGPICLYCKRKCTTVHDLFSHWKLQPSPTDEAIMEIIERGPNSSIASDPCSKLLKMMSERERHIWRNGSYRSFKMASPLVKRPTIHSLTAKAPDDSSQRDMLFSAPTRNRLLLPKPAPVNSGILFNKNLEGVLMPATSSVPQPSCNGSDDVQVISAPRLSHTRSTCSTPHSMLYNAPLASLYLAEYGNSIVDNISDNLNSKICNIQSQNSAFEPIRNSVADDTILRNALTIEKSGSTIFKVRSAQPHQLLPCSGDEQYQETVFSLGEIEKLAEDNVDSEMSNSFFKPVVKIEPVDDEAEQQEEDDCRAFSDSAAFSCSYSSEEPRLRLCGNIREGVSNYSNQAVNEGLTFNAENTVLDLQCRETMDTDSPCFNKSLHAKDSRKEHDSYNSDSSNDSDNHLVIDEGLPELQPYQHVKNPVSIHSGKNETSHFVVEEDRRLKISNLIHLKPSLDTWSGKTKLDSSSSENALKESLQRSMENGKTSNNCNTLEQNIQGKIALALQSYKKIQQQPVYSALTIQSNPARQVAFVLQPMYIECNQDQTACGISHLAAEKSKEGDVAAILSSEVAAGANSSPSNFLCDPTEKLNKKNAIDKAFLLESNLTVREILNMLKSNQMEISKKAEHRFAKKRRIRKKSKGKCQVQTDTLHFEDRDVESNSKNIQEKNLDKSFENNLAKSPSHMPNEIAKDKPILITEMLDQSQDQKSPTMSLNEKSSPNSCTLQDVDKVISSKSEITPKIPEDGNAVDKESQNEKFSFCQSSLLNVLLDDNAMSKKSSETENAECSEKVDDAAIPVINPSLHQDLTPSHQETQMHTKSFEEGVDGILNINPIEVKNKTVQNNNSIPEENDVVCIQSSEGDTQERFHVRPDQVVSQLQRISASIVEEKDVGSSKPIQPNISVMQAKLVHIPNQILKFIPPSLIESSSKEGSPNAGPSSKLRVRPIKFVPPASNIPIVWVPRDKNLPSVLFKLPSSAASISQTKDGLTTTIISKLVHGSLKADHCLISASSNSNVKAANICDYNSSKSIGDSSSNSSEGIAGCSSNSSKMIAGCNSNSSKMIAGCNSNSSKMIADCNSNVSKMVADHSNNSLKSITSCNNNSLKSITSCNNNSLKSITICTSKSISKVKNSDFKTNVTAIPISKVTQQSLKKEDGRTSYSVLNASTTVKFCSPVATKPSIIETKNHPPPPPRTLPVKNDPSSQIAIDYEVLDNCFEDEDIKSNNSPIMVSNMQYFKYLKQLKSSPILKIMVQSTDFFKCMVSTCPYTSNSPREFENHYAKLHGGESAQCAYCLRIYPTCAALMRHSICFHRKRVFACSLCFYRACSKMHVFSHLQACHKTQGIVMTGTTIIINSVAPIVEDNVRLRVDIKKIFCSYRVCPFTSNSISDMAYHIWKHAPLPEFSCFQCNFKCRSALKWIVHLNSHDIFLLHCFYCEFGSNKRLHMLNHLTIKHPDFPLMTYVRTSKHLLFNLECFLNGTGSGEFKYIQNCSNTSHCYCYLFLYHAGGDGNRMLKLLENIKTKNMHFKSLECLYCFHKSATTAKMEKHLKADHCTSSQLQYYPCMSQPLSNSDIQKLFIENQCSDENESLLAKRFQKFLIYLKELKTHVIRNYLIFGTFEIKSMGLYADLSISLPPVPMCHRPRTLAQRIIHSFHTAFEDKRKFLHFFCKHCKVRMKTLRELRLHWKCVHVQSGKRFSYQVKRGVKKKGNSDRCSSAMPYCSKQTVEIKPDSRSKFQNHFYSQELSTADDVNLISSTSETHVINHDISNTTPAFIRSNSQLTFSQKRKSPLLSSPCDKRIFKKRKLSLAEHCFSAVVGTNFSYTQKCPSTLCNSTASHNLCERHERNSNPQLAKFNSELEIEAPEPKISVFLEDYACQVQLPVSYLRNLLNLNSSLVMSNAKDIIINDIKKYYEKI